MNTPSASLPPLPAASHQLHSLNRSSPVRVLSVEDDASQADPLLKLLRRKLPHGSSVAHARSQAEALDCIFKSKFDVVLLDLGLPDCEGVEAVVALRAASAELAIIILSAQEEESTVQSAMESGADDYFVKGEFAVSGVARAVTSAVERKRSARALTTALESRRRIMDSSVDVICTLDAAGRFTEVGAACERVWGYTREELIGGNSTQWIAAALQPKTEIFLEAVRGGAPTQGFENRFVRKDGSEVDTMWSAVWSATDRLMYCVARDTTERKRHEETLRATIESALDCIITIDESSTIIEFNPAAEQTFGWSRAEAIGRTLSETIIPPRSRAGHAHGMARLLAGGQPRLIGKRIEITAMREGGAEFPVELTVVQIGTVRPARFTAFIRDITERVSAREKLEAQEEQYRVLFETNPSAMLVYALDTLRILAVNDAAVEQYGYSREEFLARNLYDLRAPAERERLTKAISTEGASSCHAGTWPHQRKDGSTILVDVYSSPTDFEGTPARISVLMDVTERKRAEEALNKSERSLRELADAMPQIVWAAQPDGSIDYYNRRWFDYTGMTFEQTLGWGWKPVLHPDDLQPCIDRWTEAFSSGQPYQIEYRFKRASDGTYRWHLGRALPVREADGTIVRWNGTCTDIHDQKLVEQALVESEKSFREVTESLPQLIWTCAEDGRCDYLSRQWLEYTGVTEQEQFGFGWAERIHPDDRAHGVEVWAESFRHGTLYDAELRIRRADGKYRWFTNRAVPLRDGSGAVRKWFGTSTDVDDLKRAEEEIQQLNAELEQRVVVRTAQLEAANKELEAFSYSVSHDLRAPLRSVDSFARIIVEDYGEKLDAEGNRLLGVVCSEAKRMGQLIDDLLDFSRVGRKELSTGLVNMTVLARDVFDGLASAARKHVRHFDLQPLPDATVDRSMFRQVFVNLINNAAKFTSRADEPAIEIGCTTADGMHTYYVKDNGAGFDERYVHKLFGVFQRLHAEHEFEGTGVGLAIVQRIVHRHGGKVWAEGKINQGATVYFALPTKEETPT